MNDIMTKRAIVLYHYPGAFANYEEMYPGPRCMIIDRDKDKQISNTFEYSRRIFYNYEIFPENVEWQAWEDAYNKIQDRMIAKLSL